jgi:hypothetical protein
MKEHFTLRYSANEDNDSVMDLEIGFDTSCDEIILKRIQAWLIAIGKSNIQVQLLKDFKERDIIDELDLD